MEAAVRPTEGMPMVVAHDRTAPADAPHLLYYGHYDVQPADPVELWQSPPFEPAIVDGPHGPRRGRSWCRRRQGPADDLHRGVTRLEGSARARLPVPGHGAFSRARRRAQARAFEPFLEANRDELAADVCVISDTGMLGVDQPAITYMLRGNAYFEVTLHGPVARPPFGHVWRGRCQPDHRALPHPGRACTTTNGRVQDRRASTTTCARSTRPKRRPGARSASTSRPSCQAVGLAGLHRRGRAQRARADVGAADLRPQRHLGRLYRRRRQDGDRRQGLGQALLPAGARPGPAEGHRRPASASSPSARRRAAGSTLLDMGAGAGRSACRPNRPISTPHGRATGDVFGRAAGADRLRRLDPRGRPP